MNKKLSEGVVDTTSEHIKIGYGKPGGPYETMTLVSGSDKGNFTYQFLTGKNIDEKTQKEIIEELKYFLVNKEESKPWSYARYHCTTSANIYSPVHWSFYPATGTEPIESEVLHAAE